MPKYDDEGKCYKCGGNNEVHTTARDSYHTCECSTKCKECGFESYWAYGFYQIEPEKEDVVLCQSTCVTIGVCTCSFSKLNNKENSDE